MRPNKQRGHTHTHNTPNFTLFHVNFEFDDKLYECRARYARRDAYAGIWSYILLHELNRNAGFAYFTRDIFISFTRCERVHLNDSLECNRISKHYDRGSDSKRRNNCEWRKAKRERKKSWVFFLSFFFLFAFSHFVRSQCSACTYIWTSTQVQRDNF